MLFYCLLSLDDSDKNNDSVMDIHLLHYQVHPRKGPAKWIDQIPQQGSRGYFIYYIKWIGLIKHGQLECPHFWLMTRVIQSGSIAICELEPVKGPRKASARSFTGLMLLVVLLLIAVYCIDMYIYIYILTHSWLCWYYPKICWSWNKTKQFLLLRWLVGEPTKNKGHLGAIPWIGRLVRPLKRNSLQKYNDDLWGIVS